MEERDPKYLQVYNALKRDIILNKYKTESYLPTETQLMGHYNAGRSTVRHALSLLQQDGFIKIRQGSGSVVLSLPSDKRSGNSNTSFKSVEIEYLVDEVERIEITAAATDTVSIEGEAAKALQIEEGTKVFRVQRIWSINGHPYNHMIQFVRVDIAPDLPKYVDESTYFYELIKKYYGLHLTGGEEHISACVADFVEANLLGVKVGDALL